MAGKRGVALGGGRTLKGTPVGDFRHHWVMAYLEVHSDVLAYVPANVPDFLAYFTRMEEALHVMAAHPGGMGARLVGSYPIAAHMHAFMVNFGNAYHGIAGGARDVLQGYIAANRHDVQRNTDPRTNEQWANVGNGTPGGYAAQQIDRLLNAHNALFNYEPSDPVDLENFFCSLPMAFITMNEHVAANRSWVSSYFPGATDIPEQFYLAWMQTYQYAGAQAYAQLVGYQDLAAADLDRHKAPRTAEEKADVV